VSTALVSPARSWRRLWRRPRGVEARGSGDALFAEWALPISAAGVVVTPEIAFRVATVFACVRVLSESVAQLPALLYERLPRGKRRATQLRLYRLLHSLPNEETTAFEFWEYLIHSAALRGNGYAQILRTNGGEVESLVQLQARYVTPKRVGTALRFEYRPPGGNVRDFAREEILHIRGPSLDGVTGVCVTSEVREAIALAIAAEDFAARFFSNSSTPSGILQSAAPLSPEAKDRLKFDWEQFTRGANARRVAVMDHTLTYQKLGIDPKEGTMPETRARQAIEICKVFRVPPHMVAELDKATFANIEHQGLDFVVHTLGPWLARAEQAVYRDVLIEPERARFFLEFLVDGLLRGDFKTRMEGYATGIQNGIYSPNDVLELENRNPRTDPGGDEYLKPLNMEGQGKAPKAPGPGVGSVRRSAPAEGDALGAAFLPLYHDATGRVVRAVLRELRAAKPATSEAWAARASSKAFREVRDLAERALAPVALAHVLAARPGEKRAQEAVRLAAGGLADELVRASWSEVFGRDEARALEQLEPDWIPERAAALAEAIGIVLEAQPAAA
jgi:HK97 family phage portal protein